MKNKQIEIEDTRIEIIEDNSIVSIKINSNDAIVYMNDDIIWSVGNEKEEFKNIPKKLRDFILNSGSDFMEYDEKKKIISVDTYVNGEQLSLYIPKNYNKHLHCRFNFITSVDDVVSYAIDILEENEVKVIESELKQRMEAFENLVDSKGYKTGLSHGMDEWAYAWWDIILKPSSWDDESIKEIMNEVVSFNQYINRIREEFDF
ncbi:hypothetical protein AB1L07_02095 [Niallia alba]|uniref:hypothetical protein n=1 Tax=Niallia alba TaxID=2729105 RepID=UPI0039A042EF